MKRLFVMLPDRECARQVVDDLVLISVDERQIHLLASDAVELEEFSGVDSLGPEDAKAVASTEKAGGSAGILAGLPAVTHPPAGLVLGGGILGIGAEEEIELERILERVFGGVPNERWALGIKGGDVMLSVDTPKGRVTEIQRVVLDHHPEAEFDGVEPPPSIFGKKS